MRKIFPIDCFGQFIFQGMILCVSCKDELKVCVVSQAIGTAGNLRVLYFDEVDGVIRKKQAVMTGVELQARSVIVPKDHLDESCILYKAIREHANRILSGNARGVGGHTDAESTSGISFPPATGSS